MVCAHGTVTLLSSTVPYLKPVRFAVYLLVHIFEVDADGGIGLVLELVVDKPAEHWTFANVHVAKQTNLDILIDISLILLGDLLVQGEIDNGLAGTGAAMAVHNLTYLNAIRAERVPAPKHQRLAVFIIH